jgi:hypothetical protein
MKPSQPTPVAVAAWLTLCCGLALPTVSHAGSFLDKLNDLVKKLPQPSSEQHPTAAGTQASPAAAKQASAPPAAIPDPPKSGTPEGTAAILKAAPSIDAGGFHLGMPADEAIARLKSRKMLTNPRHEPGIGVWTFRIRQVPDHDFVGGAMGEVDNERVGLNFTMYPNPPVVSAVERSLSFARDKAPTVRNTLEALHKKYGPETLSHLHMNTLIWLFDYQGHPLSKAQVETLERSKSACPQLTSNILFESIGYKNDSSERITQGIGDKARPGCFGLVSVKATLGGESVDPGGMTSADKGWDSISDVLVTSLSVYIFDIPLEYSASEVSRNLALHNGEVERQKEINAAQQRRAPSL